jgi:hypothetical protein
MAGYVSSTLPPVLQLWGNSPQPGPITPLASTPNLWIASFISDKLRFVAIFVVNANLSKALAILVAQWRHVEDSQEQQHFDRRRRCQSPKLLDYRLRKQAMKAWTSRPFRSLASPGRSQNLR